MASDRSVKNRQSRWICATVVAISFAGASSASAVPGALDTTFSGDGKVITDFGSGDEGAFGVAMQGDGKIVVAGYTYTTLFDADFGLARYNADGSPDTTFDGDGILTASSGPNTTDVAVDLRIQDDGKIIVLGSGIGLARYNPDGTPDTTFSDDGRQADGLAGVFPAGLAVEGDKIVVVGSIEPGGPTGRDFFVARYNMDGSLDTSFSGDGLRTTNFSPTDTASAVAAQANGKITVAGSAEGAGSESFDFALVRYRADGTLDPTFSGDGKLKTSFAFIDRANDLRIQGDGKIVVVGRSAFAGHSFDFVISRYRANGKLDLTFSGDGKQRTNFGLDEASAEGLIMQPNGRIVVAGYGQSGPKVALARYRPNGNPDRTFSGDGKRTTSFGTVSYGWDVARQADGKIVVAGQGSSGGYDFIVARYLAS